MANWTIYLRDYALEAVPVASANWSNGAYAANGYDTMVAALTTSGTLDWTFGSAVNIQSVFIGNNSFPSGTVQLFYGAGYTSAGAAQNLTAYTDKLYSFPQANSSTKWRVTITSTGKCGCVSLFTSLGGHVLSLTDAMPVYPVEMPMGAGVATQATVTGNTIEQRRGGTYKVFQLRIPNLQATSTGAEGLLDDTFLHEYVSGTLYGTQGWVGPFWLVDDNSNAYHVHVQRPIQYRYTGPLKTNGPAAEVILTLKTTARMGLA